MYNYSLHCVHCFATLCFPLGMRLGVLYTQNSPLLQAMNNLVMPFMASTLAQQFVASMLSDESFTTSFLQNSRAKLLTSYRKLKAGLEELGVVVIPADAAIFCVIDLGFLFESIDGEGTWQDERELQSRLVQAGIVLTPGKTFNAPIPGYFRVCYAFLQDQGINEFISRLQTFITASKSK